MTNDDWRAEWRAQLRVEPELSPVRAAEQRARARLAPCTCGHTPAAHTVPDDAGRAVEAGCQLMTCSCEVYRSELDR